MVKPNQIFVGLCFDLVLKRSILPLKAGWFVCSFVRVFFFLARTTAKTARKARRAMTAPMTWGTCSRALPGCFLPRLGSLGYSEIPRAWDYSQRHGWAVYRPGAKKETSVWRHGAHAGSGCTAAPWETRAQAMHGGKAEDAAIENAGGSRNALVERT